MGQTTERGEQVWRHRRRGWTLGGSTLLLAALCWRFSPTAVAAASSLGSGVRHLAAKKGAASAPVLVPAGVAVRTAVAATRASAAARSASAAGNAGRAARASGSARVGGAASGAKNVVGKTPAGSSSARVDGRTTKVREKVKGGKESKARTNSVDVGDSNAVASEGATSRGDLSTSWQLPGHAIADSMSVRLPVALAASSPFLASVARDGSYLRACVGIAEFVFPVTGLVLGTASIIQTGGVPVAPSVALFTLIAGLAMLNASVGLFATLIVGVASAFTGELWSIPMAGSLLVMGAVWCGIPIMIGSLRPFSRPHPTSSVEWWVRGGDVVIGASLAGYLAMEFTSILPLASGMPAAVAESSVLVGWVVAGATAFRYIVATFVSLHYPMRLSRVHVASLPERPVLNEVIATVVKAVLAGILGVAVLGNQPAVYVLAVVYGLTGILPLMHFHWEAPSWLGPLVPRNTVKLFLLATLGVVSVHWFEPFGATDLWLVCVPLLLTLVVALLLEIVEEVAHYEWEFTWPLRLLGALMVVLTALQLTNHLFT